ncbi:TPA: proline--tRNA ligase [Candidatus Spyradomonas excrementavium]|nr:proline--tRNA ligase [Candidatus Spyradomonas excrementavium]
MRMSKMFVQTLRDFPSDAEVMSHKLLVRAGFIRKLTSGVYNYLPLMWRVLKKVEKITREEMDAAGAQEMLMPFVQPEELWKESGRWDVYGKELMRLKDRHDRGMCLGPTHEEVITFVAREGIKSYKQLPVNLYQIQSKFRDEVRPRYGLLRGREFIMKDAYSFDSTQEGLEKSYKIMADAYYKIFERCGLETKAVQSDSGAIGGAVSHEYMVLIDDTENNAGENDVFFCKNKSCGYAANANHAVSVLEPAEVDGAKFGFTELKKVDTPDTTSIEELEKFLNVPATVILKSMIYIADKKPVMALIRADKTFEETKVMNAVGANEIRSAAPAELADIFGASKGFVGPMGIENVKIPADYEGEKIQVVADLTAKEMKNFVIGANETDRHFVGVNLEDLGKDVIFADIRLVEKGEKCPDCGEPLFVTKGIEVGNIFQLGTKYSEKMNAVFTDENGKERPFIMGCYGIGISRTAAAAVERHHDEYGIKWPLAIAPYHVDVVPVNIGEEKQMKIAEEIYNKLLEKGVEAVIDDRDERAGVKFKDSELIGFPFRITAGKTVDEGLVEFKIRETGEVLKITPDEAVEKVVQAVQNIK